MAALQQLVDVVVLEQRRRLQVERDHLARAHAALAHHVFGLVVPHADFGGDGQVAVLRDHIARRTQAVAVERAAGIAAIGEHHARRAIPGLHVRRVELVERAQVRIDAHRRSARPAASAGASRASASRPPISSTSSMLSRLCESEPCIDTSGRMSFRSGSSGELQHRAARHGPAAVGLDGVDLAVVREVAERMRQPPLRQRVGREALVEHGHRGLDALVPQVREELDQVRRHHHALVDDGAWPTGSAGRTPGPCLAAPSRRDGAP